MPQQNTQQQPWNIFAIELQKVLRKRGLDISIIDDRTDIHREKVRRLKQSLFIQPQLPVLNPEDMQRIIEALSLDEEDVLQLHAALLATAIQRMLIERIEFHYARLAALQIFPIIHQSLIEYADISGLGNVRTSDTETGEDTEIDLIFSPIAEAFDRGEEALHMSYLTSSANEPLRMAQQAELLFKEAENALQSLHRGIQTLETWQTWNADIQKNLTATRKRLQELGM